MIRKLIRRVLAITPASLIRFSAVLTLGALALMVWSMLDPTPLPVMLAMSFAQALGTLAFALYGLAVYKDLLRIRRERRESKQIPIVESKS